MQSRPGSFFPGTLFSFGAVPFISVGEKAKRSLKVCNGCRPTQHAICDRIVTPMADGAKNALAARCDAEKSTFAKLFDPPLNFDDLWLTS